MLIYLTIEKTTKKSNWFTQKWRANYNANQKEVLPVWGFFLKCAQSTSKDFQLNVCLSQRKKFGQMYPQKPKSKWYQQSKHGFEMSLTTCDHSMRTKKAGKTHHNSKHDFFWSSSRISPTKWNLLKRSWYSENWLQLMFKIILDFFAAFLCICWNFENSSLLLFFASRYPT